MSAAAAPTATADAPAPKGKKKLIIILAAVLLLVLVGGAGAFFMLKKKPHADEDGEDGAHAEQKADVPKRDPKVPPAYVPLDMFVVNLADRDAERYAQIGITLEMMDAKQAEQIKTFQPAIRNNILMVLANKNSTDLLSKEGKAQLAGEIQRAASRALGVEVPEPGAKPDKAEKSAKAKKADEDEEVDDEDKPKKKKKKKAAPPPVLPILAVHFSNFIVQ